MHSHSSELLAKPNSVFNEDTYSNAGFGGIKLNYQRERDSPLLKRKEFGYPSERVFFKDLKPVFFDKETYKYAPSRNS